MTASSELNVTTFTFTGPAGHFTARKERQARGGAYWKAYRPSRGTLHRMYLGKAQDLTLDRLAHAAATLVVSLPPPVCRRAAAPADERRVGRNGGSRHRRASAWYERQGLIADAVPHALTAADIDRARDLGLTLVAVGHFAPPDRPDEPHV